MDVALVVLTLVAAAGGWRAGLTRVAGWAAGGVVGLALGLTAAGLLARVSWDSSARVVAQVAAVVVLTVLGARAGRRVGSVAARLVARLHLSVIDRAAGLVVRGGLALALGAGLVVAVADHGTGTLQATAARSTLPTRVVDALPTSRPDAVAATDRVRDQVRDQVRGALTAAGA